MSNSEGKRTNWTYRIFTLVALMLMVGLSVGIAMASLPTSHSSGTAAQKADAPAIQPGVNGMISVPGTHRHLTSVARYTSCSY